MTKKSDVTTWAQEKSGKGSRAPTFSSKPVILKASMRDFNDGEYDPSPWRKQTVNIADLHPSQHVVFDEGVEKAKSGGAASSERPSVVNMGGKLVVTDGHHRIQAAHESGAKTIDVNLSSWDVPRDDKGRFAPK